MYQNWWDKSKAMLRWKYVIKCMYQKEERPQINTMILPQGTRRKKSKRSQRYQKEVNNEEQKSIKLKTEKQYRRQ